MVHGSRQEKTHAAEAARGEFFSQGAAILRESADTVNRAIGPVDSAMSGKKKARAVAWERLIGAGQCCNVCVCVVLISAGTTAHLQNGSCG
jgi:hypothetical protein